MKIHEYQGKDILRAYNVPIPRGNVASSPQEARQVAEALGVTSANWLEAPYNRLGFRRVGKLVRTARISRGDGPVVELTLSTVNQDGAEVFSGYAVARAEP